MSYLPEYKQHEIGKILEIIKELAKPEKVILFGSHASDRWVEDEYVKEGTPYSYIRDYDFLVVIKKGEGQEKEYIIVSHIENRTGYIKNSVTPIVHDIDYINEGLRLGQYFFTDIIRDGILLYDTGNYLFDEPAILTREEKKEKAQGYFDTWFPQGRDFLDGSVYHESKRQLRVGAFSLHQAAESFYNTALLVFTGYKPKTYHLERLRNYAKHISPELYGIFHKPALSEQECYLFDLLRRSYIDARYRLDYPITVEELRILIDKVSGMQEVVGRICREKIERMG